MDDKLRAYRDGVEVGSTTKSWNPYATLECDIMLGYSPDSGGYDKFISDNIIIWDYAKTDFSHRFTESPFRPLLCNDLPVAIPGTDGHDVLRGTDGPDVIHGLGGHDVICGGNGNDTIRGNDGDDDLYGGGMTDCCYGGADTDTADGCEVVASVP